jgi:membrane carboxypeptidase/penicillin-binding protein PbpC
VLSQETAFLISHVLLDNNARQDAFGPSSLLVIPNHAVSVKTGTTDDLRDNWTIGFTPQYLVAVWVGNNDNSEMNQALVSGVTGAAPIWNRLMRRVLEDSPDIWPKQPDGVAGGHVCIATGTIPPNPEGDDKGCQTRYEYFIRGTVPPASATTRQQVLIDKATGDIAKPGVTENTEMQEHEVLKDTFSTWCVDCPHP